MLRDAYAPPAGFSPESAQAQLARERDLVSRLSRTRFREHLEAISHDPHPAGSPANERVAAYLATVMRDAGFQVSMPTYEVYMPVASSSQVALVKPVRMPLNQQEHILDEDPHSAHDALEPAWLAYTASGDVVGEVVYVNYGRREDFCALRDRGVDLAGKVAIARYGGNFRGYKALYAQEAGAAALLLYSDPADGGYTAGPCYPEGRWLSDSTLQRGSLLTLPYPGDPLTPGQAALPSDRGTPPTRLSVDDVAFPRIPVAALPYSAAQEILGRMRGPGVPKGWQGGLPQAYRISGGPDLKVRVQVAQTCRPQRIANVIGTLTGEVEPDRWIVLGCHYDAWTFGTADPNSGTAALLLLAEALGAQTRAGHRQRRSILIGHWDAEELGIIGSVEWVEEHLNDVTRCAVAYLNADMAATGAKFAAVGSPLLRAPLAAAADSIRALEGEGSAYARWCAAFERRAPTWTIPGGGSDHVAFYARAGVPAAQASFSSQVPVYHSAYDNLAWYQRFADPSYQSGPALAAVDGLLALRLANAEVLPLDTQAYAQDLAAHLDALVARAAARESELDPSEALSGIERLREAAQRWETARDAYLERSNPSADTLNTVNDRLVALERQFLCEEGIPDRPWYRSQYAAPDPIDGYGTWALPALRHAIEEEDHAALAAWQSRLVDAMDRVSKLLEEARAIIA